MSRTTDTLTVRRADKVDTTGLLVVVGLIGCVALVAAQAIWTVCVIRRLCAGVDEQEAA